MVNIIHRCQYPIMAALVALWFSFLANNHAVAGLIYTGSISGAAINGIDSTGGSWGTNSDELTLSWNVSENADGSWNYRYVFTTPADGALLDEFIVETADNVEKTYIHNVVVTGGDDTFTVSQHYICTNSSTSKIDGIRGSMFETSSTGTETIIEFDIFRAPTWGDFYAKSEDGDVVRNTGFIDGEAAGLGNDPEWIAPHNGPELFGGVHHILVPDSVSHTTPVPSGFLLAGIGGVGLLTVRLLRRKRRKTFGMDQNIDIRKNNVE